MKQVYIILFLLNIHFVKAQVGYGTSEPDKSAAIEIQASDKGVLVPRIALTSSTQRLQSSANNANALLVFNIGAVLPQGFYYWKANLVNDNGITTDEGSWIALGSEVSSMPKFFYMPSVVLPTISSDTRITEQGNYRFNIDTYTVNLYNLFSSQFSLPVASSPGNTGLSGFVLSDATQYEYFVTFADSSLFTQIAVDNNGVLTYKVHTNAIIRNGSFMNIVLKVKN